MTAREAFRLGQMLVVPSRAESLPYVVLEAAAACVPMVATNVGGIPEIFGPFRRRLIACDSVPDLTAALTGALGQSAEDRRVAARELAASVQSRFSIDHMVDGVLNAYRDALEAGRRPRPIQTPSPVALSSN